MASRPNVLKPHESLYDQDDSTNRCVLCGEPDYTLVRTVESYGFPFSFSRCRCGLVKQAPMPNERFFEWFFNSDLFISSKQSGQQRIWGFYDYLKDEGCRMATSRLRYRRLRQVFEEGRGPLDVLKIGPSTGTMLSVLNEHGHRAIGCDVSSRFLDYAKSEYGVRIDHGRFEDLPYGDESFDLVLLFNVVENVPNIDEFLDSICRRLRPGGCFVLNYVPMDGNLIARLQGERYFMFRPPICYMFETDVLTRLLARHGFEVRESLADVRFLNLEKILSLLGWMRALRVARALRVHRIRFPVPAYPSRILVAERVAAGPHR